MKLGSGKAKRFLLPLLAVLLLLSGCEGNNTRNDRRELMDITPSPPAEFDKPPLVFGIIYPMVNPTYETITENSERAATGHNIKLLVQAPDEANLEQQIRIMEMMIKQEVDGIAIDPVDSQALIPVINKAVLKGIPVVCFESDSPASRRVAFIGADNYETGAIIGQAVNKLLNGKGMILVQSGMPHMFGLSQRLAGLQDYLKNQSEIDILDIRNNDGTEEGAMRQQEQMISAHPHFSALINLDLVSSSSSILVWKAKGLKRYNIALGLTPAVKESQINGQITRIISQNEQHWGEAIISTLLSIAKGQEVPEFVNTEIVEIHE
ncbi:sugar ABC transporter substrate-binding protein [Paenibacillus tianjinensis]|uniref:Substrate-binding domain-containing protein n=1 Tax=Paenibacillus tianjinensis TaxID=2810347 RepID=A0ABX7LDS0_9BACL|nr:substrate-binding domain-containing protein [Paenibacillus tianjinensis]QSF46268.1 substrate-binding domain-containing protein [Paenibacillus tianjinensis]